MSPTRQVVPAAGLSIVASGGVFPAVIVTEETRGARGVADPQIGGVGAGLSVGERRCRRRRIVEDAVVVKVPCVCDRVAIWIGGRPAIECDGERCRPTRRLCADHGDGWLVLAEVADATDGAAQVHVEEVAARSDLNVDWLGSAGNKRAALADIGQPVRSRFHRPDTPAGVVGEEQRALVLRWVVPALVERERDACDRRATHRTDLGRNHQLVVVVAEVRGNDRCHYRRRRGSRTG